MAKYGPKAQQKVKNHKQAIAIGMSEAKEEGYKVPAWKKRQLNIC